MSNNLAVRKVCRKEKKVFSFSTSISSDFGLFLERKVVK